MPLPPKLLGQEGGDSIKPWPARPAQPQWGCKRGQAAPIRLSPGPAHPAVRRPRPPWGPAGQPRGAQAGSQAGATAICRLSYKYQVHAACARLRDPRLPSHLQHGCQTHKWRLSCAFNLKSHTCERSAEQGGRDLGPRSGDRAWGQEGQGGRGRGLVGRGLGADGQVTSAGGPYPVCPRAPWESVPALCYEGSRPGSGWHPAPCPRAPPCGCPQARHSLCAPGSPPLLLGPHSGLRTPVTGWAEPEPKARPTQPGLQACTLHWPLPTGLTPTG